MAIPLMSAISRSRQADRYKVSLNNNLMKNKSIIKNLIKKAQTIPLGKRDQDRLFILSLHTMLAKKYHINKNNNNYKRMYRNITALR
jgi:uncharacterized coiled-coil DUF342 family protein